MARIAITVWPQLAGGQRTLLENALALSGEGHEVVVLSENNGGLHHAVRFLPTQGQVKGSALHDQELAKWNERWQLFPIGGWRNMPDLVAASMDFLIGFQPDLVVAWNPLLPRYGVLDDLCKATGVRSAYIEHGLLKGTLILDGQGVGGHWSGMSVTMDEILRAERCSTYAEIGGRILGELIDSPPSTLYASAPAPPPAKAPDRLRVAVLGPAEYHAGVYPLWHPDHRITMPYFSSVAEVLEELAIMSGVEVFLKRHPLGSVPLSSELRELGVQAYSGDPLALITSADVVVCFGTKLELNVLLMGKPLVLPAASWLRNKGLTIDVEGKAELRQAILSIQKGTWKVPERATMEVFLGWYAVHHAFGLEYGGAPKFVERLNELLHGQPLRTPDLRRARKWRTRVEVYMFKEQIAGRIRPGILRSVWLGSPGILHRTVLAVDNSFPGIRRAFARLLRIGRSRSGH